MTAAGKRYIEWLSKHPCAFCGSTPVEVAHVKGPLSRKTRQELPRRTGVAEISAIPACPGCHRTGPESIHNLGERAVSVAMGGEGHLTKLALTYLAEYVMGGGR